MHPFFLLFRLGILLQIIIAQGHPSAELPQPLELGKVFITAGTEHVREEQLIRDHEQSGLRFVILANDDLRWP